MTSYFTEMRRRPFDFDWSWGNGNIDPWGVLEDNDERYWWEASVRTFEVECGSKCVKKIQLEIDPFRFRWPARTTRSDAKEAGELIDAVRKLVPFDDGTVKAHYDPTD